MITFQVCHELESGDFIIHEEFDNLESAKMHGLELKKEGFVIVIFEFENDEDVLNIYKL